MDGGGYRREQSLAAPGGYEYGSPAGKEGGGQLPRRSTFFWISTRARTHLMPGFPISTKPTPGVTAGVGSGSTAVDFTVECEGLGRLDPNVTSIGSRRS